MGNDAGSVSSEDPDASGITKRLPGVRVVLLPLPALVVPAPTTFTYSVTDPNNNTATGLTVSGGPTVTVNAPAVVPGLYTYTLTGITDNANVSSCSSVTGTPARIRVNAAPGASISSGSYKKVGVINVCQNEAAPAIAFTGTGGPGPGSYTFNYTLSRPKSSNPETLTVVGNPDMQPCMFRLQPPDSISIL